MLRRGLPAAMVGAIALLVAPQFAHAGVIRISTPHNPAPGSGTIASVHIVRASDGVVVASRPLRRSLAVTLPKGVYIALGNVAVRRHVPLQATAAAVVARRPPRITLRLRRTRADIASAASAVAASVAPVITAQGVVLSGTPASGQPDIDLDGALNAYLYDSFHDQGVRVVDQTAQFTIAAVREQLLSSEGRLATPLKFNPLAATHTVRGDGRIRKGKVDIDLRIVDDSGVIVAVASAHGKATQLRDVVRRAVRELASEARGKLRGPEPEPPNCAVAGTPNCYGVQVTAEGIFDQTGGWGSGSVAGPDGHGSVNEGFDSLEHGSIGSWPSGTPFTLTATPNMGSHFDHWSGSCTGTASTCTLRAQPKLDTTAYFAEDLWTLTVVNENPSGGEAAGEGIGCGNRENTCSRVLAGQTSAQDFFQLYIYPGASYLVSQLTGCDQFVGSPEEGGDCKIAATSNKTVTVDFACNPDATTQCAGKPAAYEPGRPGQR